MHEVEPEWPNARRQAEPHRCIIFLHVPKTAGWTLRGALHYKYPSEILFLDDPSRPLRRDRGDSARGPAPGSGGDRARLLRRPRAHPAANRLHHRPARPDRAGRLDVQPHPAPAAAPPARRGRWLRDGARGVRSQLRRRRDRQPADQADLRAGAGRGAVPATPARRAPGSRPRSSAGDLEQAKRNLDDFLLVGLTERFDETFIMLRRMLGWRLPMYATRNVGRAANGSRARAARRSWRSS